VKKCDNFGNSHGILPKNLGPISNDLFKPSTKFQGVTLKLEEVRGIFIDVQQSKRVLNNYDINSRALKIYNSCVIEQRRLAQNSYSCNQLYGRAGSVIVCFNL
jgi:hypothetical protein